MMKVFNDQHHLNIEKSAKMQIIFNSSWKKAACKV